MFAPSVARCTPSRRSPRLRGAWHAWRASRRPGHLGGGGRGGKLFPSSAPARLFGEKTGSSYRGGPGRPTVASGRGVGCPTCAEPDGLALRVARLPRAAERAAARCARRARERRDRSGARAPRGRGRRCPGPGHRAAGGPWLRLRRRMPPRWPTGALAGELRCWWRRISAPGRIDTSGTVQPDSSFRRTPESFRHSGERRNPVPLGRRMRNLPSKGAGHGPPGTRRYPPEARS